MQASTQGQTPAAPQAPSPSVSITTVGADGKPLTITVPRTSAEVEGLLARRSQLSDQLTSATERRSELSEEIKTAPDGVSRTGLENRIRVLDDRILRLETDLATVGSQLASAPGDLVEFTQTRNANQGDDWEEGFAFGGGFAFLGALIVYFFMRRRWRRRAPARRDQLPAESASRLERLEHGMEAIAVEIERISEGQRFVTKLLSEHEPLAASNRLAQPVTARREPSV